MYVWNVGYCKIWNVLLALEIDFKIYFEGLNIFSISRIYFIEIHHLNHIFHVFWSEKNIFLLLCGTVYIKWKQSTWLLELESKCKGRGEDFQQIHSLNISWRDVEKSRREGFEREQISQGALLITSWNKMLKQFLTNRSKTSHDKNGTWIAWGKKKPVANAILTSKDNIKDLFD